MNNSKKIISLLLSVIMIMSLYTIVPFSVGATEAAIAATAETDGDYEYRILDDNTAEITGYWGGGGDVTIPSTLGGYTITGIGWGAFEGLTSLTSITIPDSVTSIGQYAFSNCKGLTSITIPDSVTSIGESAFSRCTGLTSIDIPDSVTSIGDDAFSGCTGLKSITIPDSVTSIGYRAFSGCTRLTSVTFSDSVTSIGSGAFSDTAWYNNQPDGLVYVGKVAYEMKGTCPSEVVIKDGTLGIAGFAFSGCTGLTSINIPDSVTSIDGEAFSGCTGLKSITIPDSVTSIGYRAFSGCTRLTSVTFPDSVTSIGSGAFSGCTSLTSVTIPNSVTSIGISAFSDTAWYNNQPDGLVYAGKVAYTMKGTCPSEVVIKDGTLGIEGLAFFGCTSLTSITIPGSVTSIGSYAFEGCTGLTSVTIPDTVTSIGDGTFYGCTGLTSVDIPDSVTSIGEYAFYDCEGLTSVTIPGSVTSIGDYAFYRCTGLTSVDIPDSVASIGSYAFKGCTGLTSVTIPDTVTSIGDEALGYYYDDDWNKLKIDGFTIYGYEGSEAERYAKDNEFTFIKLTEKKDEASGIITTVPDDIELRVVDVLDQMPAGTIKAYDISLTKDGETVQPENIVTVKIPCTNENAKAYRLESDGKMTDMKSKYKDGYIVFTTDHFSIYMLSEPKPAGVTVSGNITSYLSDEEVNVTLFGYEEGLVADISCTDSYTIEDVPAGEYVLTVSKKDHTIHKYSVTVTDADVTQDVKICPKGDVNGDGETDIMDCSVAQRYIRELTTLDAYQIACGDVSGEGDGELDIQDVSRILRHIRELAMLY